LRGKTKEKRKEWKENPKKKRNERKLKKPGSYFHQEKQISPSIHCYNIM
jgi:hypothetical protein